MTSAFIFYTILFLFLFLVMIALPAGMILAALLFFEHERLLWKRMTPLIGPLGRMLARGPRVVAMRSRFPRAAGFLIHRLDPRDPWGMPATLTGIVMFAGLWFFLGILQDIVAKDPLVILDIRLHNTVPLFRTAGMSRMMMAITELGGAAVLSLVCLGTALLALAQGRSRLAAAFVLAIGTTGLLSVTFKVLVGNERPVDALLSMHDASFPSGHMLSGTVVYGLLAALLLGSGAGRGIRALGVTLLLLVIVGIGLSRLYLGVHWPSDLLGSLGLALIVLAALLFFLHYAQPIRWIDTFKLPVNPGAIRIAGIGALLLAITAAVAFSGRSKILALDPRLARPSLDIGQLRGAFPPDLARWLEDLIGRRMEPISLVLVGSEDDILRAFSRAGWLLADPPTPMRVLKEGIAAMRNLPNPTGPATPAFFMDQPQSLTFEKPDTGLQSIRRRHHTRLWQTPHCLLPDCRRIWVATAGFDVGLEISQRLYLPTNRIGPDLDRERALITAGLVRIGSSHEGSVTVLPPLHATTAAGDPFWTDGQAVILVMP
jgi:membrane-associated phospholipid phosphatase